MSAFVPEVEPLGAATLARKWRIDVNTGTKAAPVWVRVRGVSDFSPSEDPSTEDTSDYDSRGWKSETVTAMGWGAELTVERKQVVAAAAPATYDPGQEFLRLHSVQMGVDNVIEVRYYEVNGTSGPKVQAYQGSVGVRWAEQGGGMDGKSTAKVTLGGQGQRVDIAHPAGA